METSRNDSRKSGNSAKKVFCRFSELSALGVFAGEKCLEERWLKGDEKMIQLKVNGVDRSFNGDPEMPLLWYLIPIPWRACVAPLVVWLVVGLGTLAVAASAGGSDPGAVNFEMHCATCHAPNGSGDTAVGKSVHIPDLRSPAVQSQSDAQLVEVIANGKGAMPPFKSSLSADEIDALAKHIRQVAKTK